MSLPFRAVAIDLDGTLLDTRGVLREETRDALLRIRALGVHLVLASGRMAVRIKPYAEEVGPPISIVAFNGGQLLERQNGRWELHRSHALSRESCETVARLCEERELFLNIYAGEQLFAYQTRGDFRWCEFYRRQTGAEYAGRLTRLEDFPPGEIVKLLIIETPAERDRLYSELFPLFAGHTQVLKSNPEYLEFLPPGISKAETLKGWLSGKGLIPGDLLAFGDAENDLEMLKLAGRGIALANATPGLKKAFPLLSPWTNDENAVARELRAVFQY